MADETRILNGQYKNFPITFRSSTVSGGRKVSIQQFPNRDTQTVEDLGLSPRKFTAEINLRSERYFEYRNSLLAVLERPNPGVLIHPLYGRIDDVVAVNYSINESFNDFGGGTVTVNFEVDENTGIPQATQNVSTQIITANERVQAAVASDIAENYSVTNSFSGNFSSAVDKVNEIIDTVRETTNGLAETADEINEFSAQIGDLSANVNSLVSDPLALANAIGGLFESVNGLSQSTTNTASTFSDLFGFGDDDVLIPRDTSIRLERDSNNKTLNASINSSSLGYSYLAVALTEFETTDDIDEASAALDEQYRAVQNSFASDEVKEAITLQRLKVIESLNEKRVAASQVITINTLPTSARLLAFNYYGDDDLGQTIIELNQISDVSFVEGDVKVVTE